MTDSTLEPRSGLRSREKALDQSANVLDLDTDLNFRQTLRIVGRGLKYIRFFKLRFAGKFFLMWLSLLTPLILPWPIKIVIDNVILGLPIGEGTVYPPYFAPFVNFLDGKSPVEMMSWVLLLGASWVILLGAFGASGGSQDYTDGFLAEGHDTATKTENEANQAASKIAGLLGFFEYRLNLRLTQSLNHLIRAQLFERINHLPMRLLNDQRIGDSVYRMMYDTPSITNVFYQVIISPTLAYLVPGFYDAVEGNCCPLPRISILLKSMVMTSEILPYGVSGRRFHTCFRRPICSRIQFWIIFDTATQQQGGKRWNVWRKLPAPTTSSANSRMVIRPDSVP